LPRNDILSRILSIFNKPKLRFKPFLDGLNNFEISYPEGWKYDKDIAVVDGKYTISFRSGDGQKSFTIAVDAKLPMKFNFAEYVRSESGPSSGICADMKKTSFHDMPAFKREYMLMSGGSKHFGGCLMFHTLEKVFSLSWSAPEKDREGMEKIFDRMRSSFSPKRGFMMREG